MNVIARLEYELAYYDSAVHRFNHWHHEDAPWNKCVKLFCDWFYLLFLHVLVKKTAENNFCLDTFSTITYAFVLEINITFWKIFNSVPGCWSVKQSQISARGAGTKNTFPFGIKRRTIDPDLTPFKWGIAWRETPPLGLSRVVYSTPGTNARFSS